jgi:hypothetical protein
MNAKISRRTQRILEQFVKDGRHIELNRRLRTGEPLGKEFQKVFDRMQHALHCNDTPRLSQDLIVYRGLGQCRAPLISQNELGFIWCTPDAAMAMRWTHDTSAFYGSAPLKCEDFWRDPRYEQDGAAGTLLIIRLPAGTAYFEKRGRVSCRRDLVFHQMIVHVTLINIQVVCDTRDSPLCLSADAVWK